MSAYGALLERGLLPLGDRLVGQKMMARLRFLREAQWWDPEDLHTERTRRLQSLLAVAHREVPFYRSLFGQVPAATELASLPIVTKAALRAGYPHITTRPTGQRFHENWTSGSTGTNFCVREDAETAGWHRASLLLAFEWSGWRIGDPHVQTGVTPRRGFVKAVKDRLLRCAYVSAFDLSDTALDRVLHLLDARNTAHVHGYPASLFYLARRALQTGWNRPLRSVVTWGDTLYTHYRETIERAFGTRVLDIYGVSEGMQICAQCEERELYHIHTLDVIVECVDDAGRPVQPGHAGHLLLTRLHPGPMPLIRYQVGDMAVMSDRRCACGRGFFTIASIQGRDTDVVITRSGNRLIVHFFTGILNHFGEIECFQIVQENADTIVVRVVPSASFSEQTVDKIASTLRYHGADLEIEVEMVKELSVPETGKTRLVINKMVSNRLSS